MKKAALQPFCAFIAKINIAKRGVVYEKLSQVQNIEF